MSGQRNTKRPTEIVWRPQAGPQKALVDCPIPEILFGGARGGGKTDGVLGKWSIKSLRYGTAFNAIMFRRTTPSQDDAWERAKEIYGPLGAKFREGNSKSIRFPGGGRIRFRPLETVADAEKYQGQNLTDAWVEEAGQYPDPAPIDRMFGALRSPHGVPTQLILTANPGGPGQQWIKGRYIDPAPGGMRLLRVTLPNGSQHTRVFIPSFIEDNRLLLQSDPGYIDRLYLVGSEQLVRAWLEGDWTAVEGAYFDGWSSARHVIEPFAIPPLWMRFRSMDWGSAKPFSVGWWAVVSDDHMMMNGQVLPRGCMVRYREWYGIKDGQPNVGVKLYAGDVAQGILDREGAEFDDLGVRIAKPTERVSYGVLDPSAFTADGGPSIAETMALKGAIFQRADNKRVSQKGALGGWDQLRGRLKGDAEGRPMIVTFKTCRDSIRTIPVLQHDPRNVEDVDTEAEDHAADEWRYACMSRPWVRQDTSKRKPVQIETRMPTHDEVVAEFERQMRTTERI